MNENYKISPRKHLKSTDFCEKVEKVNFDELLEYAFDCLENGIEISNNEVSDLKYANSLYRKALSAIKNYFHQSKKFNIDYPRAFFCKAKVYYGLASLAFKNKNFSESHTLFMQSTFDGVTGLKKTSIPEFRELYFKIIKNCLISLKILFKKDKSIVDTKKYINEYLPFLKKEFLLPSSGKECEELKSMLNKFEQYLSILDTNNTSFWKRKRDSQSDELSKRQKNNHDSNGEAKYTVKQFK